MEHDGPEPYVYVAEHWEESLNLVNGSLDKLRAIFPLHLWHINETGSRAVDDAMGHMTQAIVSLHNAGRHVLGAEQYDRFMEDKTEKDVEMNIERGEI